MLKQMVKGSLSALLINRLTKRHRESQGKWTVPLLEVGHNKSEAGFELNERGNMVGSKAAITHLFRPVTGEGLASASQTQFTMFQNEPWRKTNYTMDQLWYDLDIVVDFIAQAYYVFHDGTYVSTGSFNAKTDGTPWTASDFYGWSLGAQFPNGRSPNNHNWDWPTMTTLIDRIGYIYAVVDRMTDSSLPSQIQQEDVIFSKFKIKSMVDGITQGEFVLDDDSDSTIMQPRINALIGKCYCFVIPTTDLSAIVTAVNFKQSAKKIKKYR